jgi:hypothetical protein
VCEVGSIADGGLLPQEQARRDIGLTIAESLEQLERLDQAPLRLLLEHTLGQVEDESRDLSRLALVSIVRVRVRQHAQHVVQAGLEVLGPRVLVGGLDLVDKLLDQLKIVDVRAYGEHLLGHIGLAVDCGTQIGAVHPAQLALALEAQTLTTVASERILIIQL